MSSLSLDMPVANTGEPAVSRTPVQENVWTATGHERPVFFDEHGRRRRWVLLGGALGGGASAFWLGALVAGAIGFSSLPAVGVQPRLIASRAAAHTPTSHTAVMFVPTAHRRRSVLTRHSSSFGRDTELAVSRGLLSER